MLAVEEEWTLKELGGEWCCSATFGKDRRDWKRE
jgi:hypothetical protein